MGKILAVTGLTGKKTGGHFAKILSDHIDIIKEKCYNYVHGVVYGFDKVLFYIICSGC